ncbi:cytochrome P450 9e2-like [Athalia rosae]|uniref:cytochrome P450 9e2-like n=1 Tax=Athalia rosae TaxID=37344 RepID=UPI0020339E8E|nr:cytochrome P450 9e2-like [Athalia rosae]
METWVILLTILVGAAIYWFSTRNFNFFKNLGIPYVKPWPIFGNMGKMFFRIEAMPYMIQEVYKSHPDAKYIGFFDFSTPIIMIRDPELIKQIAIKDFDSFPNHRMFITSPNEPLFEKNLFALKDDEWREMRALLSPAFTSSKMKMMFEVVSRCAIDFTDYLAAQDPQPEELNMKETFSRYTLDVIATTAFGLSTNSMRDRDNEFYKIGKEVSNFTGLKLLKFFVMRSFPWLAKLVNVKILDGKSSDYFTNVIKSTIETREREGIVRPDMIHLMMQGRDRKGKSALSLESMTAQAFIFLLGGLESPAVTMSFVSQHLALNSNVQKKLQAEIDEMMKKSRGKVSYEEINAMKYLDAVVNETLRMYTPGVMLDRIGSRGFTLPPALPGLDPLHMKPFQNVWIPVHSLHHDEKYYSNPDQFDPERFNDENKDKIDPLTYLPFGIGPRICIANRFALMVVKLALFYLLAKCDVLPCSKTKPKIRICAKSASLTPEGGFWLKLRTRK